MTLAVFAAISMTACGAKSETGTSKTSSVADDNTQVTAEKTEAATPAEETPDFTATNVDYSDAKSRIDEFYEYFGTLESGLIKDDREASWLVFESFVDYKSGGSYDKNWDFYVIDEEAKQYHGANTLYPASKKEETKNPYDYYCRIGNGTYKIYAIYQNDEAGVYFFATDEVVIDDSNVGDYNGLKSVCYNLTEMIGEDFTALAYELNYQ
ncbi:MAG: hypothetical protein ACI4Q4_09545 [Oscillospiraceae bacterium]